MGIDSVWQDFVPEKKSLKQFVADFIREFGRQPRLAVDAYQWIFQIESNKYGAELRGFMTVWIRRLMMFISLGYEILIVFDGPSRPKWKRGSIRTESSIYETRVNLAKDILNSLGIPYEQAPGEAEAECAMLQQEQVVDYVFSTDADTLLFGATKVMFFLDQIPSDSSDSDNRWVKIFERNSTEHPRSEYLLRVLLSGGDYDFGVNGIGSKTSKEAAQQTTGFSQELVSIYNNEWSETPGRNALPEAADDSFDEDMSNTNTSKDDIFEADFELYDGERQLLFDSWRSRLNHELHTNEHGFFAQKHPSIEISDNFPDPKIMHRYCFPLVNEYSTGNILNWFDPNLTELNEIMTRFSILPVLSQNTQEKLLDNTSRKAADVLLGPCFISHILKNSDKLCWYSDVRKKRRKVPRSYSEYVITIRPENYQEILGTYFDDSEPLRHDKILVIEELLAKSQFFETLQRRFDSVKSPISKLRTRKKQFPKNNSKITDFFTSEKLSRFPQKSI